MTEELIQRLEKATGPDRELDFAVLSVVDPRALKTGPLPGDPKYTSSLDAAMTLVSEGCEISITDLYGVAHTEVGLNHNDGPEIGRREDGDLKLALVIAALKFRARSQP